MSRKLYIKVQRKRGAPLFVLRFGPFTKRTIARALETAKALYPNRRVEVSS